MIDYPLKCFRVEGYGCDAEEIEIIFAKSSIAAKRIWGNHHDWPSDEIAGISATRKPEWDCHAPGPVPALEMIDAGWWFECHGCSTPIMQDEIGQPIYPSDYSGADYALDREYGPNSDLPIMAPVELSGQRVYCRQECCERHQAELRRIKRMRVAARRIVEAAALRKWPGVTLRDVSKNDWHVYVSRRDGYLLIHDVHIRFEVPGMKHGGCSVRVSDEKWKNARTFSESATDYRGYRENLLPLAQRTRDVAFYCANGDKDVWDAWVAAQKEKVPA